MSVTTKRHLLWRPYSTDRAGVSGRDGWHDVDPTTCRCGAFSFTHHALRVDTSARWAYPDPQRGQWTLQSSKRTVDVETILLEVIRHPASIDRQDPPFLEHRHDRVPAGR